MFYFIICTLNILLFDTFFYIINVSNNQKLNIYSNIVTEKFVTLFAYYEYMNGDTNCGTIKDIISMCLIAQVLITWV